MKNRYDRFLTDKERKGLQLFSHQLRQLLGDELQEIELFGSKVRGDSDQESDIDILIIVKSKDWRIHEEICGLAADINLDYYCNSSPVIYSQEEYGKNRYFRTLLIQYIEREGIPL